MIPRVIHRCWFGDPMPDKLAEYGETWAEHHPDWVHRLWTEENLPHPLRNQDIFDRAEELAPHNVGQLRADVARYELLARFGGVYVDCDFECQRSLLELVSGVRCFAAWEVPGRWVNNAILGAVPEHPFIRALVASLPHNVEHHRGAKPNRLSGPQYVTRIYRRFAGAVTVYPSEWFYPYLWHELDRGGEQFPHAYAVHHWHNRRTNA